MHVIARRNMNYIYRNCFFGPSSTLKNSMYHLSLIMYMNYEVIVKSRILIRELKKKVNAY